MKNLKAVILAGGKGTRLYPIGKEMAKPLLPVKRKPIINYVVELFSNAGIEEMAVLVNETFEEDFIWWKKRFYPNQNILFSVEKEPLGTFGCLWQIKEWLGNNPFFLSNGDDIMKIDISGMASFHNNKNLFGTIALAKVENPKDYGVVLCENGIIQGFLEKPKNPLSNYISAGLYLLSHEIFKYHPGAKFSMIEKDLFPKLAEEKKLAGFKFDGKWFDCGTLSRYGEAIENWD